MLRKIFGHSVSILSRMFASTQRALQLDIPFRTLFPTKERSDAGRGVLPLTLPALVVILLALPSYGADGVFTNLRATNSNLTNITATNINFIPVFKNCSSNNQTYILPASGARTIMKIGTSDKVVTITPSVSGHTIMGLDSYILYLDGETVELFLIGTTWYRR